MRVGLSRDSEVPEQLAAPSPWPWRHWSRGPSCRVQTTRPCCGWKSYSNTVRACPVDTGIATENRSQERARTSARDTGGRNTHTPPSLPRLVLLAVRGAGTASTCPPGCRTHPWGQPQGPGPDPCLQAPPTADGGGGSSPAAQASAQFSALLGAEVHGPRPQGPAGVCRPPEGAARDTGQGRAACSRQEGVKQRGWRPRENRGCGGEGKGVQSGVQGTAATPLLPWTWRLENNEKQPSGASASQTRETGRADGVGDGGGSRGARGRAAAGRDTGPLRSAP